MILIAVSILNLLRKTYILRHLKIYIHLIFLELYLHWIIIDYVHMCNQCATTGFNKELLNIIAFFFSLVITLEKNPPCLFSKIYLY